MQSIPSQEKSTAHSINRSLQPEDSPAQDPNLQNIPTHSALRACFKSDPGHSFLGADYSQIELRLLAHFSQDPELIQAFKKGRDIHTHTASLVFTTPETEVDSSHALASQDRQLRYSLWTRSLWPLQTTRHPDARSL